MKIDIKSDEILSNDRNKNGSRCKTNRWKISGQKVTPAIAYYRNVEAYKDVFLQIDFLMQILLKSYLILLENFKNYQGNQLV